MIVKKEWMNGQGEFCMHKLGKSWWSRYYDINFIIESIKGEKRKEKMNNTKTSNQEGSSIHQYRGDISSSNKVLVVRSLLIHLTAELLTSLNKVVLMGLFEIC